MAEKSLFWPTDGTGDGTGTGYTSSELFEMFRSLFTRTANLGGVAPDYQNELAVVGTSSPVTVDTGAAVVYGSPYKNTISENVAIPTPASSTRVDYIVLRTDWTAQTVRITRIAGTEGAGTPALTQTAGTTWDIPLATVSITTGGVITVTDAREWIGGLGDGDVSTVKLADDAVTTGKIADGAVDTAQIADYAINPRVHISGQNGIVVDPENGNARGDDAVDLQTERSNAAYVASGENSVVGGGQDNRAPAQHAVVGGGFNNNANAIYSVIGGGQDNATSGTAYATIGGGEDNVASDRSSTVAGGSLNQATGNYSAIGGGVSNVAAGSNSTVSGGDGNEISSGSNQSTISGGQDNTITNGFNSIITGGSDNTIDNANSATILGGSGNTVNGNGGIVMGAQGVARSTYQFVHSRATGSNFGPNPGSAQFTRQIFAAVTSNDTPTSLTHDGGTAADIYKIPSDSTAAFRILLVARRTDADNESAAYQFVGCIDNNAGTTALVGTVAKTVIAEDNSAWDADVTADDTNDGILITVTGEAAKTIRWVATIEATEVTG